jgi:hypothetical protein
MTRDEAVAELAAVAQGFEDLYTETDLNGDGCWWCCGGGDEWRNDLVARQEAVLAEYPDLATVNG